MDVEEIVKGIDPGLQDVFLEKVVEEVTEVLDSNAIRVEESDKDGVTSEELGGEEFDVDEDATKAQIKRAFVKSLKTKKLNKKVLGEFISLVA